MTACDSCWKRKVFRHVPSLINQNFDVHVSPFRLNVILWSLYAAGAATIKSPVRIAGTIQGATGPEAQKEVSMKYD